MKTFLLLVLAIFIIGYPVFVYNSLIKKRTRKEQSWSDIDIQLKRRYNLIPNLINTVKGYAKHEAGVLDKCTKSRTDALNAGGVKQKAQAENMLTDSLKSLFAVAENYPDLKASKNFEELQRELSDTEDKIQAARRFYNTTVNDLNIAIKLFPQNIIAKMFNFKEAEFFELEDGESVAKKVVDVNF